jgi:hypothetical protein
MLRAMSAGEGSSRGLAPRRRGPRVRPPYAVGFLLIGVIALLAVAQLVLPQIAARVLRDRVGRYGEVQRASVKAFPAIELLWGDADSARVSARHLRISAHRLVRLLVETKGVADLSVKAEDVALLDPGFGVGAVIFQAATLEKHGQSVDIAARLTRAALQAALPAGVTAEVLSSEGGEVGVSAGGRLFGFSATFQAVVHASEGKLLLTPTGSLLAGLAKVTLFSDSRLEVLGVSARPATQDGQPQGAWLLGMRARLRQ